MRLAVLAVAFSEIKTLFNRGHKCLESSTRGLEQAKTIIATLLENVGDDVLCIPGLKAAAQMAIQIIEVAQRVQSNKAACARIADKTGQIVGFIIVSLSGKSGADVDPCLKRDMENFRVGRVLDLILRTLEALTKPDRFLWVNQREEDPQNLASPSLKSLVSVIRQLQGVIDSHNIQRQRDLIPELTHRRAAFKRELLWRDAIIRRIITPCAKELNSDFNIKQDHLVNQIRLLIIMDLDAEPLLSSRIASIVSSCSRSVLAELRQWQQAIHVLGCFDTTIAYTTSTAKESDKFSRQMCNAMVATVLAFTPPGFRPAQQRPDDRERAMHRPCFYDEPQIRTLISSMNEDCQLFFQNITDRGRSSLPYFPKHFRILAETPCLHGCSKLFDPAFNSNIAANHGAKHQFATISYPIRNKSADANSRALSEYKDTKERLMD